VAVGANEVNNLGFQIDDPDNAQRPGKAKSYDSAKDQGRPIAQSAWHPLGRIVNFTETPGYYRQTYMMEAKSVDSGGGVPPSVPVGENEITVNVNYYYQIR